MKNSLRLSAYGLLICLSVVAALPAQAAVGDFCRAAGNIPGHQNSSNQCIPDEVIGQSCGNQMIYDQTGDCVSSKLGQYCTASPSGTRGKYDAKGMCIAEPFKPGDTCVILPGTDYGRIDKNLTCVADTDCAGKQVGQLCDASGQVGHCDSKLACVADPVKGTGDCVGKSIGQLCDANGQIGHCDDKLACVADSKQGAGQTENPTPGSGSAGKTQSPAGENVTLINPLGPLNCSGSTCLMSFIQTLLSFIVRVGSVVIIVALVYVGYQFVAAQGNPTKLQSAKQALQWTIIGGLILLGSQAIASAIQATIQAISIGS